MNSDLARALIGTLPIGEPRLFNPWMQRCNQDTETNGPEKRLTRLSQHLDCDARYILCGEAVGYQGCRFSGVAFTSERLVLEGAIPRVSVPTGRLTKRGVPYSEPSASVVWGHLKALGITDTTILWNALQLHPFKTDKNPLSNRTPSVAEFAFGYAALRMLQDAFPEAKFIAVGLNAQKHLARAGITAVTMLRHPAHGGATEFRSGLSKVILQDCKIALRLTTRLHST